MNYVDQGAKIEFARVDLSVVEENENNMAFRAASPEGVDTDTVHFSRTIKLRSKNQVIFLNLCNFSIMIISARFCSCKFEISKKWRFLMD